MTKWSKRDGGGSTRVEEGLGRIEVYPDESGHAIDINGRRAWSGCVGGERQAQLWVDEDIRTWKYIQGFIANSI